MEFRELNLNDVNELSRIVINMYSNLDCLEWFSPMPFYPEHVKSLFIPRYHILGVFDNDTLCAVSSLDYECGHLIGTVDFPPECDTNKLVEIGFTIVDPAYRGHGLMKQMVNNLTEFAKKQGYTWIFGKVHKDNLASSKSFVNKGFSFAAKYKKPLNVNLIRGFLEFNLLKPSTKADILQKLPTDADFIYADYNIWLKKM